jgi:hypothetical protein
MSDKSTCEVTWRLRGSVGPTPINMRAYSYLDLNLLTGQIVSQRYVLSLIYEPALVECK